MRIISCCAIAFIAFTGSAAAQADKPAAETQMPAAPTARSSNAPGGMNDNVMHRGEWRASKLIGVNVYNPQNEKVGDVNEVLMDQSGRIMGVVLGVGGFLGLGEHDVLVKMDQLKAVMEPRPVRSDAPPARDQDKRPARAANEKWYPDHFVINATKDQLKSMPEFKYSSYN